MRVLHVVCDLSGGGAERLVLELCARRGESVHTEVAAVQPGGSLGDRFAEAGIAVHQLGRRPGRPGLRAFARLLGLCRGFDVVHTHLWAGDAWGRPAAFLADVPVRVATEHNIDRDEGRFKHAWKAGTAHLLHCLVAVSHPVARYWQKLGVPAERIVVIPNGVDASRFHGPWHGLGSGRVLAIGRLVPQKGFDVLLAAMKQLPDVELEIAGDGPLREELAARAPANVRFLGEVDDVEERLKRAAALVVPSRWEGFGLVAVEGMAAGVPVVASRVDGLAEVVGNNGVLVPPEDPNALVAAVDEVLQDPERAVLLSAQGRSRAAAFSLDRMVDRYETLYSDLLD